jgi:hypothetical protein
LGRAVARLGTESAFAVLARAREVPRGAFYAFPDVTGVRIAVPRLADRLLEEAGESMLDSFTRQAGPRSRRARGLFHPFHRLHRESEFPATGSAWRPSREPFTAIAA